MLDTKTKGDLAEQAAVFQALQRGWAVLKPFGDRLPYDLVFDINKVLVKIQVKYAWFDQATKNYVIDTRRTKTNRRQMVRSKYCICDFDFALAYIEEKNLFYVFPIHVYLTFKSSVQLVEVERRQRKPKSAIFRDGWDMIEQWAMHNENCVVHLSNSGKPLAG